MNRPKLADPYAVVLRAAFLSDSALAAALMRSNKRDLAERALRGLTPREERVVHVHLGLMTPESRKRLRGMGARKGTVTGGRAGGRARQFKTRVLRRLSIPSQPERPPQAP